MKCLRCNEEMKHYKLNHSFGVYGKEHKPGAGLAICQESHNPHSIYECPKCGYMELSSRDCEDEDLSLIHI